MEPARLLAILARTPGLMARHLIAAAGPSGAEPISAEFLPRLLAASLPRQTRVWLERHDERLIDADLRLIEADRFRIVSCLDSAYPPTLISWAAAPACLYVAGDPQVLGRPALTIVGARQPSAAGRQTACDFAAELARAGLGISGGLAEGIDAAAQEGALAAGGHTIAVCTTGLDRVYPPQHARLAARISAQGCLVSPFPPGAPPRRHHFPLRNRLLSALGTAVLLVEAAEGSGGFSIAAQARGLERRVFAVPGSIRDPLAQDCNRLIRAGARLVQQSRDILDDLNFVDNQMLSDSSTPSPAPASESSPLDNKYEMLLDAAGFEPVDIDVLALRTGWSGHVVASMLLLLELRGRIAPQPGGRFCRLS